MTTVKRSGAVPVERISKANLVLRGQRVLLDAELAALYGVTTKALNQPSSATRHVFRPTFYSG